MSHQNESASFDISKIKVLERLVRSDPYAKRELQREPPENTLRLQPPSFSLDRRSAESLYSSDQDLNQDSGDQKTNRFKMKESSVSLRKTMDGMRKDGTMIDFVIKANTLLIPCHKLILVAQAKYFELMFKHEDTAECDFSEMFDSKALQVVIDYFYTGRITFEYDDVIPVIKVVDFLQVNDNILKDAILDYVDNNFNDALHFSNCVEWFVFGDQVKKTEIKRVSYDMMINEYQRVFMGNAVLMLNFDQFTTFLRDIMQTFCTSQYRDQLLKVSSRWVKFDEARRERFADITAIIDCNHCSKDTTNKYSPCVNITPSSPRVDDTTSYTYVDKTQFSRSIDCRPHFLSDGNTASSVRGDNTASSLSGDNTASSLSADTTASFLKTDNTASSLSANNTASSLSTDNIESSLNSGNTASSLSVNNTASSLSDDNTASSLSADNITSSPSTDNTASSPSDNNTASTACGDNTASSPCGDNTASSPCGDNTASSPCGDNTASSPCGDNTASSPCGDNTASSPSCDNTASSPSGDNTASSPSGDNTASSPSADNAATRVPKVFICSFVKEIVWTVY